MLPYIDPGVLQIVLVHLAPLFLVAVNGDLPAAHNAARSILAAYDPRTEEELHLATDIITFGFQALQALSTAADPELSLNQVLRLRGGAVSLSRESHKSRRKLDLLKRARQTQALEPDIAKIQAAPEPAAPAEPPKVISTPAAAAAPAPALAPIPVKTMQLQPSAQPAITPTSRLPGLTEAGRDRAMAEQITAALSRRKAEHEHCQAVAAAVLPLNAQPRAATSGG